MSVRSRVLNERVDLRVGRESPDLMPREPERAVHADIELAGRSLDQCDISHTLGFEPVPRTEGLGLIASTSTIVNDDFHIATGWLSRLPRQFVHPDRSSCRLRRYRRRSRLSSCFSWPPQSRPRRLSLRARLSLAGRSRMPVGRAPEPRPTTRRPRSKQNRRSSVRTSSPPLGWLCNGSTLPPPAVSSNHDSALKVSLRPRSRKSAKSLFGRNGPALT